MTVSAAQVEKLMKEIGKGRTLSAAALAAGMDRKTARKYKRLGAHPGKQKELRSWRTRANPFEQDWAWVASQLETDPGLDAKTLFDALQERFPGRYADGQLRTLQRHVRRWRATQGPDKQVFFPQLHRPGEAGQTDFTDCNELGITVAGEPYPHKLCHFVLPFSNWEWATTCSSESMSALRRGTQSAVQQLGHVPQWHQTDHSTAATHRVGSERVFNDDYLKVMTHLGMKPRTTAIGAKEQNGDVESLHRSLKRRLDQKLRLRGSRDFASPDHYESWVQQVLTRANRNRVERLQQELDVMKRLTASPLPEFKEVEVSVTPWSTIRVLRKTYSVPSRLIREQLRVRVYDHELRVYLGSQFQLRVERLLGQQSHYINYRHVIWWLVRKPGAFARYRYRDDMFPTPTFRRAYDAIVDARPTSAGDLEYLRILHLAAATMEAEVERALETLLEQDSTPSVEAARQLIGVGDIEVPQLQLPAINLRSYDALIGGGER